MQKMMIRTELKNKALIALLCFIFYGGFSIDPFQGYAAEAKPESKSDVSASTVAALSGPSYERAVSSLRSGAFAEAIANFDAILSQYNDTADSEKRFEILIMLSDALQSTGQYKKALKNLDKALVLAKEKSDQRRTAIVLGAIGNVHVGMGNDETALKFLNEALAVAENSNTAGVAASILNNLGNLHMAGNRCLEAMDAYRKSWSLAEKSQDMHLAALASLNGVQAAMKCDRTGDALPQIEWATRQYRQLKDSHDKAYGLINSALAYSALCAYFPDRKRALLGHTYTNLKEGLAVSLRVNDRRTASYAYGYLGKLYEDERQYPEALDLTRKAVFSAQQTNATEAAYKWQWQCGRILAHMGKIDEAIVSYRNALHDIHEIREEMSSCYANPDASYRKNVSGVCFDLVRLLINRSSQLRPGETADKYLAEARETLEVVKVYELREYFKDDCIDAARVTEKSLDAVSDKAVVVYPIILDDRVEMLVSISGHLKRYTLSIGVNELTKEIREFRKMLVKRTTWEFLPHAQRLYDWIIRPMEKDIDAAKPDTIVFVPDGALRTIPMGALHDGKQFLITRYPIAVTPSLNLADPRPFKRENAKLLSLGLTKAVQGFPGLPYVSDELKTLQEIYGGTLLMDENFRLSNVESELKKNPFSMVHIASHGQFGGNVENTFLLAYDEKFNMDRLGEYVGLFRFREEPLELLTLSACETAAGDDRAALGLAGVAVRTGARSALASLWHVNDPASYELITEFYRQLRNPLISRAAALQAAQMKLIADQRYDHPGYWAPFLLINNWL